jgi:hypothetical protein
VGERLLPEDVATPGVHAKVGPTLAERRFVVERQSERAEILREDFYGIEFLQAELVARCDTRNPADQHELDVNRVNKPEPAKSQCRAF